MRRDGFILPVAIFLLLALGAAALSTLLLARTELLLGGGDHLYLRDRVAQERKVAPRSMEGTGSDVAIPGGGGYHLLRGSEEEGKPAAMAIQWQFDPVSAARDLLPGAVEFGAGSIPMSGIVRMTAVEGCPEPQDRLLVRRRPPVGPPFPDPPLPAPPRIGPIGIEELLALEGTSLAQETVVPPGEELSGVLLAPSGASFRGAGRGVLVSPGSLRVAAGTIFQGLVAVAGDLRVEAGARLEGIALAAGEVSVAPGGVIAGCPAIAAEAIARPPLTTPRHIVGGELLGRF